MGIVATNQARKDWALGIETVAILAKSHKVRLWIKTDVLERHWSIPALLVDYGIVDKTMITLGDLTDDEMAQAYSACDICLGIAPEGFGYVHVESQACGTPIIVGSHAGGAENTYSSMQVDPIAFRYEGVYACKRPVYRAEDWAKMAEAWSSAEGFMNKRFAWDNLWEHWEKWFREGVK